MNPHEATDLPPEILAQRFDLLSADTVEYALCLADPDGFVICWNRSAERLFGYRPDEAVGRHFSFLSSAEDVITGQPEHELRTAMSEGHTNSVRWQVRKDGSRFWCQANATVLYDEDERV